MSCALRVDASDAKEAKRNAAARPTLLYDRLTKNARSVAAQTRGGHEQDRKHTLLGGTNEPRAVDSLAFSTRVLTRDLSRQIANRCQHRSRRRRRSLSSTT